MKVAAMDHPALAWKRAGLMAVTGRADGPGLVCPAAITSVADQAITDLRALCDHPEALPVNGALLLGERARLLGLNRQGRVSANGTCCILDTQDDPIALNLARDDDRDLLPILLDCPPGADWGAVAAACRKHSGRDLVAQGIALSLPIAGCKAKSPLSGNKGLVVGPPRQKAGHPLVLDFTSLWAGPLAGSLLAMAGADVIKIESRSRPDGARFGHAGFYDLLNHGKASMALDFGDKDSLAALHRLVDRADIVIEASRPRALRALGIDRDAFVARGGLWLAITAHDDSDRVGFGDDASVEGGMAEVMAQAWGEPMFAGDAIADPLTGIQAALAVWSAWRAGEARLIRMSLSGTVRRALQDGVASAEEVREWQALAEADAAPLYPMRRTATKARALGADNATLLQC